MTRESMEVDVVIVGAGPAGLCAAIRLKQLCVQHETDLSICVVEKGAEVGAHILSGAVLEPRALDELLPGWQSQQDDLLTPVTHDNFLLLTEKKAVKLPTPPQMQNHGNFIISLGELCRYLAQEAEQLGVDIYPGFAATEVLYNEQGHVRGIATGDMGIGKDGEHKGSYQPGMELHAKQTIIAEGAHGSLSKMLIEKFHLRDYSKPQTYGIGLKEVWQVSPEQHQPGKVIHTVGWPLDSATYGGSFIYHCKHNQQVNVGFVVGLDYRNPYLSPYQELQRFKTHPAIKPLFENAERISYGARALNEGGYQAIPKTSFPGGVLVGCSAGFLNVAKIKGSHTAMKSGMLAAETIFTHFQKNNNEAEVKNYNEQLKKSWIYKELRQVRNIRPAFRKGLWAGLAYAAIDTYLLRGRAPWTFKHHSDHTSLEHASDCTPIDYPKPDGKITFDKLTSVYLSGTNHEEDQPVHLRLKDPSIAMDINYKLYDAPEQRYCPGGVYEIVKADGEAPRLQINAQNCLHCKTCDIKDITQNINWTPPEGGGGPNYPAM